MKAINENKNTYRIIGEHGDFFLTEDNKGKNKMFAKKDVVVIEINEMPKAKVFKSRKSVVTDAELKSIAFMFSEADRLERELY